MPSLTRLAILDDYQGAVLQRGPWERLSPDLTTEVLSLIHI